MEVLSAARKVSALNLSDAGTNPIVIKVPAVSWE